eukprot:TRINITY_DN1760_c0_g1_i1.p1 TRINITY_DN1760_c0_g1~~TRINITY_DN1760_c0_g1_i1.p1  ORF type:complete len:112 (-),score=9.75 TRINITY_DN1760_c0_g1_i1:109-444(-)
MILSFTDNLQRIVQILLKTTQFIDFQIIQIFTHPLPNNPSPNTPSTTKIKVLKSAKQINSKPTTTKLPDLPPQFVIVVFQLVQVVLHFLVVGIPQVDSGDLLIPVKDLLRP